MFTALKLLYYAIIAFGWYLLLHYLWTLITTRREWTRKAGTYIRRRCHAKHTRIQQLIALYQHTHGTRSSESTDALAKQWIRTRLPETRIQHLIKAGIPASAARTAETRKLTNTDLDVLAALNQ